jgi:hypothetical protein
MTDPELSAKQLALIPISCGTSSLTVWTICRIHPGRAPAGSILKNDDRGLRSWQRIHSG